MASGTIKAVIFDVGGVLHDSAGKWIIADASSALGVSPEALTSAWKEPLAEFGKGTITEEEFWRRVLERLNVKRLPRTDLFIKEFVAHYGIHNDVLEIVQKLKKRGYKVAVLSNTNKPHADYQYQIGLYERFDAVVLSHEVGLRKPDPRIWEHALEELGVRPEEAVFIDDIPEFVAAAAALGLRGLVYESAEKLAADLRGLGVAF